MRERTIGNRLPGSQACGEKPPELKGQPQLAEKGEPKTITADMTRCVPKKCLASEMICLHQWNEPVPCVPSVLSHSPWNERLSMGKEGSGLIGAELVDGIHENNVYDLRMSHSTKARIVGSMSHASLLEHTSPTFEWNRRQRWRYWQKASSSPPPPDF